MRKNQLSIFTMFVLFLFSCKYLVWEYPNYKDLNGDQRAARITARMVLSHSTGFPNWRFFTNDGTLRIMFEPGSRFSYSGEGIHLLQMVVEKVAGNGLEELSRERVFEPLTGLSVWSILPEPCKTLRLYTQFQYLYDPIRRRHHEVCFFKPGAAFSPPATGDKKSSSFRMTV